MRYDLLHFSSAEYRATAIILDIAQHRLFRPVRSDVPVEKPKYFVKIEYLHKGINAINFPGLLRSRLVTDKVPVYFKNREPPIISYQYTNTVASKLFNFSPTPPNLDVTNYPSSPRGCQCQMSKYCYQPHGHIITGDLKIIECQAKRTCFQRTQIQRARQDRLESHREHDR